MQCLPAWFRFAQCLRRYRDTREAFPHLVNAGKYSTSFFKVAFGMMYKTTMGKRVADWKGSLLTVRDGLVEPPVYPETCGDEKLMGLNGQKR